MEYPYAVVTHAGAFVNTSYHRTSVAAESAVCNALRAQIERVTVRYLRHPVADFVPSDLATIVNGDASTFLIRRIERGIEALGPNPTPLLRGKRRQDAVALLVEQFGLPEGSAAAIIGALHPYLK